MGHDYLDVFMLIAGRLSCFVTNCQVTNLDCPVHDMLLLSLGLITRLSVISLNAVHESRGKCFIICNFADLFILLVLYVRFFLRKCSFVKMFCIHAILSKCIIILSTAFVIVSNF